MSKWSRSTFKTPSTLPEETNGDSNHPTRSTRSSKNTTKEDRQQVFKRPLPVAKRAVSNEVSCGEPWVDLYRPKSATDLAVHPNKVKDVREWLTSVFEGSASSRVCLLTGPTGSGKTATLKVLCDELKASIVDWTNSEEVVAYEEGQFDPSVFRSACGRKDEFFEFLTNAAVHAAPSWFGDEEESDREVILVEEFPYAVLRAPEEFGEFLAVNCSNFRNPVVFIVTHDPGSGGSGQATRRLQSVFPESLIARAKIRQIAFNPSAPTYLASGMKKILDKVESEVKAGRGKSRSNSSRPSDETVSTIAELSNGDIRLCVNALQFACASSLAGDEGCKLFSLELNGSDTSMISLSKGKAKRGKGRGNIKATKEKLQALKRRKLNAESDGNEGSGDGTSTGTALFPVGDKDAKLSLFSLLGKVLYAKRNFDDVEGVEKHREKADEVFCGREVERKREPDEPLLENPENLVDNSSLSPDGLMLFLHQNYLDFFKDMKSCSNAASYFSAVDALREEDWRSKEALTQSSCSYLLRGLMFERYPTVKAELGSSSFSEGGGRRGFHQLTKPRFRKAVADEERNRQAVRSAFIARRSGEELAGGLGRFSWGDSLFTDDLPMLRLCLEGGSGRSSRLNYAQNTALSGVTKFSGFVRSFQNSEEALNPDATVVEEDYFDATESLSSYDTASSVVGTQSGAVAGNMFALERGKSDDQNLAALIEDFDD